MTPPVDDDDSEENTNLLKMGIHDKFEHDDLLLLAKIYITVPMENQELKYQLKNFSLCARCCFGQKSDLYTTLKDLADHIEHKETSYNYKFNK